MGKSGQSNHDTPQTLRRALSVWDLVLYGIIVIQPTAPMPIFGVVSQEAAAGILIAALGALETHFSAR